MSAIEIVTCPLMTTPLSRTRLSRSLRTSLPPSRSSRSLIGAAGHKMVGRPWSGEVEPEARRLSLVHDFGEPLLKGAQTIGRDEKRGVENHDSRSVCSLGSWQALGDTGNR